MRFELHTEPVGDPIHKRVISGYLTDVATKVRVSAVVEIEDRTGMM